MRKFKVGDDAVVEFYHGGRWESIEEPSWLPEIQYRIIYPNKEKQNKIAEIEEKMRELADELKELKDD